MKTGNRLRGRQIQDLNGFCAVTGHCLGNEVFNRCDFNRAWMKRIREEIGMAGEGHAFFRGEARMKTGLPVEGEARGMACPRRPGGWGGARRGERRRGGGATCRSGVTRVSGERHPNSSPMGGPPSRSYRRRG